MGKMEYQKAIILELEKQGCNVIGIFTNNMANL